MRESKSSFNLKNVTCPFCKHKNIRKFGLVSTINGKKQRYQCYNCGHTMYGEAIAQSVIDALNEGFDNCHETNNENDFSAENAAELAAENQAESETTNI